MTAGDEPADPRKRDRLRDIIARQSLLSGDTFRLASGGTSSMFFDLKKTTFDAEGVSLVADLILEVLAELDVDAVGGLEMGAVPIVAAICAKSHPDRPIQGFFVRKEAKQHGRGGSSTATWTMAPASSSSRT